jgi:UDPglucose--hexose-1-phosphate uridylyltransferase
MGIFIFDPLTGSPTIIATNRAKRHDQGGAITQLAGGASAVPVCYFCKGSEGLTPQTLYQDADDWNVRVFNNKFPLMPDHEVIVHSPQHAKDMEDFSHEQNVRIIRAYLDRVSYFGSQDKEVIIFNNKGGRAGASIVHPHSQIVAAKGFPGILEKEKESALHYYNERSSCFWCDEWREAVKTQSRVVYESSHFVLFCPKACRWSYELVLVPKQHKPNFGFIDDVEINDLAKVLPGALIAYKNCFSSPDRNFWVHTVRYEPYHWHIGFIPHLKVFGALELGAGIWVSDKASPEDAGTALSKYYPVS